MHTRSLIGPPGRPDAAPTPLAQACLGLSLLASGLVLAAPPGRAALSNETAVLTEGSSRLEPEIPPALQPSDETGSLAAPTKSPHRGKNSGALSSEAARAALIRTPSTLAPLVARISRSVVTISALPASSSDSSHDPFNRLLEGALGLPERIPRSLGSGFILDDAGLVVTNHHVIKDAGDIRVRLHDDREYLAHLVGVDARSDLALLSLVGVRRPLHPSPLGDSDRLAVGDGLIAIGNPYGLSQTVTVGILSAKGRALGTADDYLQTDAAINPGNSGGPLFNLSGRVIGINAATVQGGQGLGFAIPINSAREVLELLRVRGRVTRGWLGLEVQELTADLAHAVGLPSAGGALVASIAAGGPADRAGILPGDVLTRLAGKPIDGIGQLPRLLTQIGPGRPLGLTVWRRGEQLVRYLRLDSVTDGSSETSAPAESRRLLLWGGRFGVLGRDLTIEERRLISVEGGVMVLEIDPEGPAGGKLEPGDLIVELDRQPVPNLAMLTRELRHRRPGQLTLVRLRRRDTLSYRAIAVR